MDNKLISFLKTYFSCEFPHSPPEPTNIEGNAESARVIGLMPWMDYEFQVIASNILGSGEPSIPSHTIRTQQAGKKYLRANSHYISYQMLKVIFMDYLHLYATLLSWLPLQWYHKSQDQDSKTTCCILKAEHP